MCLDIFESYVTVFEQNWLNFHRRHRVKTFSYFNINPNIKFNDKKTKLKQ